MVYLSGSIHETAVWRIKSSFYLNTMDNTLEFLLVFLSFRILQRYCQIVVK